MRLEDNYFEWLYQQVASINIQNPAQTYWSLLREFHGKEFVWIVPNDDNRVEDGRDLRYQFLNEIHGYERHQVDPEWIGLGCSFLEMLIGVARRLAFEIDGEVSEWFWHLIENIGLTECNDSWYNDHNNPHRRIAKTMNKVIWRRYQSTGEGGLFPLQNPDTDQREVEIWVQLNLYIMERI